MKNEKMKDGLRNSWLSTDGEGRGGGAPAEGPGGGKPQKTIQSPDRLYKAPKRLYNPTDNTKTQNIRQNPKTLNKDLKYQQE